MKSLSQYSVTETDDSILNQMTHLIWGLSKDQQAAIAVAALFESFEPREVCFDYGYCCSRRFDDSIMLLQTLSLHGKLALCRAIAEHLAVVEMAGREAVSAKLTTPSTSLARAKFSVP